ncbi:hypothetical protein [Scytonema sp. NUACC26]|uniref:hypothetical protein n=1 Tax=Scytonema sp. NUACC26 TaxID=3140176 RepID=UPI0034DB9F48
MNNKIIYPVTYINSSWVDREFKQFASSLSIELKLSLNSILAWTHLWRQGRLDRDATHQAFEEIEQNVICQISLIEQLLKWRLAADKLEGVNCNSILIDTINQQFERDQSSLAEEYQFYLDRTLNLTHIRRESQLSQASTVTAFEAIEQNAKRQSRILEKLLNWRFNPNHSN